MEKNIKVVFVAAVSEAIKYRRENSKADEGEVIRHILRNFKGDEDFKRGIIAAVSRFLYYRDRDSLTEKQAIARIVKESDDILGGLQQEEEK
ncbi:hypothetical protein HYT23_06125 [Candidatus Pacearchaeota archaeon]|nr:hypothetical protein [Candidatus Pacearchaeota archaeon]